MVFDGLFGQTCGVRVKLEDVGCHGSMESSGGVLRGLRASRVLIEQPRSWLDHQALSHSRHKTNSGDCKQAYEARAPPSLSISGAGSVWKGSELVCQSSEVCNSAEHVHVRKQLTLKYQIARCSISP